MKNLLVLAVLIVSFIGCGSSGNSTPSVPAPDLYINSVAVVSTVADSMELSFDFRSVTNPPGYYPFNIIIARNDGVIVYVQSVFETTAVNPYTDTIWVSGQPNGSWTYTITIKWMDRHMKGIGPEDSLTLPNNTTTFGNTFSYPII